MTFVMCLIAVWATITLLYLPKWRRHWDLYTLNKSFTEFEALANQGMQAYYNVELNRQRAEKREAAIAHIKRIANKYAVDYDDEWDHISTIVERTRSAILASIQRNSHKEKT